MYDAVIIGGGPAGIAAAITAKKRGKNVIILERNDRIGKKILLAGNGKCNINNVSVSVNNYHGDVSKYLNKCDVDAFFKDIGLLTRIIDNRVYPYSESGKTVLNVFRKQLEKTDIITDYSVKSVIKKDGFFVINSDIKAKKVVVCTGSNATVGYDSYDILSSFGHKIDPIYPALVPLKTDTKYIKTLSGVRAKCQVKLFVDGEETFCEEGEVQFKSDGIGGIVILNASRFVEAKKDNVIAIDFLPDMSVEEVEKYLLDYGMDGAVLRVVGEAVEKQSEDRGVSLAESIKSFLVTGVSLSEMKYAQVARGGAALDEFDDNLQSDFVDGLYACGEVLDVDGECGGYNMHWAFLSGIIVGENI